MTYPRNNAGSTYDHGHPEEGIGKVFFFIIFFLVTTCTLNKLFKICTLKRSLLSVPCGTLVCVWETVRLRRLRILFSL